MAKAGLTEARRRSAEMDRRQLVQTHHVIDDHGLCRDLGQPGAGLAQRLLRVFHHGFGVFAAHLRYRIDRQLIAKWGGWSQHTPTRPHMRQLPCVRVTSTRMAVPGGGPLTVLVASQPNTSEGIHPLHRSDQP